MISHQDFWVPSTRHKYSVDTATQWSGKDIADLETNQERERNHDGCVSSIRVVGWFREDEIAVCKKGTGVGDECGANGKDRTDQTFVYEGVYAAAFDHADGC